MFHTEYITLRTYYFGLKLLAIDLNRLRTLPDVFYVLLSKFARTRTRDSDSISSPIPSWTRTRFGLGLGQNSGLGRTLLEGTFTDS